MFATDILRIKAQLMCDLYRPQTLIEMSGIMGTGDAQYAEAAIQLLKSETVRGFRIEVAADSLVESDEISEKQNRMEFLSAVGSFMQQTLPVAQQAPELTPLLSEMLLFGVRAFKASRQIEGAFDTAMAKLNEPKEPQPPPPDPEMMKLQAQQQTEQGRMQLEQGKFQAEMQAKAQEQQMTAQLEQARNEMEAQREAQKAQLTAQIEQYKADKQSELEAARIEFERWKAELDAQTKITVAQISAQTTLEQAQLSAAQAASSDKPIEAKEPVINIHMPKTRSTIRKNPDGSYTREDE